jgi:hypothetical protein
MPNCTLRISLMSKLSLNNIWITKPRSRFHRKHLRKSSPYFSYPGSPAQMSKPRRDASSQLLIHALIPPRNSKSARTFGIPFKTTAAFPTPNPFHVGKTLICRILFSSSNQFSRRLMEWNIYGTNKADLENSWHVRVRTGRPKLTPFITGRLARSSRRIWGEETAPIMNGTHYIARSTAHVFIS